MRWALTLLVVVLLVAFRFASDIGLDRRPSDRFTVVRVIDGDSVELAGGDRLRLLGIDTPEKGEMLFDEARLFLQELTLDRPAEIKFSGRRRDRYGRLLGYLYVDTVFVNRAILENGLGYLYLFKDTDQGREETKAMLEAQRHAMRARVGLWQIERSPEEYYIAAGSSFRFHRPGCRTVGRINLDRSRTFGDRYEALYEGLSPCRGCKP
jgi:micrococcal nuclease